MNICQVDNISYQLLTAYTLFCSGRLIGPNQGCLAAFSLFFEMIRIWSAFQGKRILQFFSPKKGIDE
jgi:hypothetical protein